jgi:DNA-binding transcriptional regulator LsrR (DeoR family)
VRVVPFSPNYPFTRDQLARAGAELFDEIVSDGSSVAISGGFTPYEMIAALPERPRDIEIFPVALIGRGPHIRHIDPLVNVTLLWAKCGRTAGANKARPQFATVLPPEKDVLKAHPRAPYREFLEKSQTVQNVYTAMQDIDVVFAGLGPLGADSEYKRYTFDTATELLQFMGITEQQLIDGGAVGDICYNICDKNGEQKPEWDFFPTLKLKRLRELASAPDKRVVVIAGQYKERILQTVLRSRLCNALVTDEQTAEKLLE